MSTNGSVKSDDYILRVNGLKMHFPITQGIIFQKQVGAIKAVDGLNFNIKRGETLGLVGESGCGKSTTPEIHLLPQDCLLTCQRCRQSKQMCIQID